MPNAYYHSPIVNNKLGCPKWTILKEFGYENSKYIKVVVTDYCFF